MSLDFTLDDLTKTLETWKVQATKDSKKLSFLAKRIRRDFNAPAANVVGFCDLLSGENLTGDQLAVVRNLKETVINCN